VLFFLFPVVVWEDDGDGNREVYLRRWNGESSRPRRRRKPRRRAARGSRGRQRRSLPAPLDHPV